MRGLRPGLQILDRRPLSPLGHGLRVDPELPAQRRERSLRSLYCCSDGVRGRGAPVTYLSHKASFHSNERIAPSNRGIKHQACRAARRRFAFVASEDRPTYRHLDWLCSNFACPEPNDFDAFGQSGQPCAVSTGRGLSTRTRNFVRAGEASGLRIAPGADLCIARGREVGAR